MELSDKQVKKNRSLGVPKFIRHLYSILSNEDPYIIAWSADGMSIQLLNIKRLEQEVLPKYFKHNKLASFQRQLNYFGFRKWTKTQSSICTFSHGQLWKHTALDAIKVPRRHPTVTASIESKSIPSENLYDTSFHPISDPLFDSICMTEVHLNWNFFTSPIEISPTLDLTEAYICDF